MARRTPGLQARSQVHSYWGQFQYDTSVPPATFAGRTGDVGSSLLPNASVASALAPSEFTKLEAGDTAATIDTTVAVDGAEFGLWTCISPGTVGVGNAVWVRMDNASLAQQTIRDAHRIVVGITGVTTGVPATDTLLNLSPYTAGVSADFIDTGDGAALALALATAAAMTGATPDVRVVSGTINLNSGAVVTPLAIPAGVKLLGAGSVLTTIKGRTSIDQGIFTLAEGSSLESMSLASNAPPVAPGGASQGLIEATGLLGGNFSVRNVNIEFTDDATRVARTGIYAVAGGSGGTKSCTIDNVNINITGNLLTFGIQVEGYTRSTISNCTVLNPTIGIQVTAGSFPILGNGGVSISNCKCLNATEYGIGARALGGTALLGLTISDSYIQMTDVDTGQPMYALYIESQSVIDQVNISGVQAHWSNNALNADRCFARVTTQTSGAVINGLSFQGCGATSSLLYAAPLTAGLRLDALDADSIRGSDLGCDFAGSGPLPMADIIQVTGADVLWEHAHPRGLA